MVRAILRLTAEMLEIRDAKTSDPCAWYALILCVHALRSTFCELVMLPRACRCVLCALLLFACTRMHTHARHLCAGNLVYSELMYINYASFQTAHCTEREFICRHPLTDRRKPHRAPRAVFSPSVGLASTLASRTMATTSRATTNADVPFDTPLQRDHRSPLHACVHAHLLHACATCFCVRTCFCMHMDRSPPARPPALAPIHNPG